MVAGQACDLEAESREVTAEELEQIHRLKTGALIIAAARCGAIIADASETELAAITDYAAQLGLLFQITDDLLDITATAETLGKTPGKDLRSKKATYPALYGVEATRQTPGSRPRDGLRFARPSPSANRTLLRAIADFILERGAFGVREPWSATVAEAVEQNANFLHRSQGPCQNHEPNET